MEPCRRPWESRCNWLSLYIQLPCPGIPASWAGTTEPCINLVVNRILSSFFSRYRTKPYLITDSSILQIWLVSVTSLYSSAELLSISFFETTTPLVSQPLSGTTRISWYLNATILDLIWARMMEVVMTTGAIRYAKLQSYHHHQHSNTELFYRSDALLVTQPTVSEQWNNKLKIYVDWQQVEQVSQSRYLGSLISEDGYCTKSIEAELRWQRKYAREKKKLFTGKMNLELKKRIFKCLVWSIALYAAETWTLTQIEED